MGEIADMMLSGLMCEGCGVWMDDLQEPGYPRRCYSCRREERVPRVKPNFNAPANSAKVACEVCGRHVKAVGLADHMRDKHAQGKPE